MNLFKVVNLKKNIFVQCKSDYPVNRPQQISYTFIFYNFTEDLQLDHEFRVIDGQRLLQIYVQCLYA